VYVPEQPHDGHLHNSIFTSAADDQEAAEADEGIGESETDVASNTDADASCTSCISSFSQHPHSVANSASTHEDMQQHSKHCDTQTIRSQKCETDPVLADDVLSSDDQMPPEHLSNISSSDQSCLTDDREVEHLLESQNCESSQTPNVPYSSCINVDSQGLLEDANIAALSEDCGSSHTYEVMKPLSPSDDDPTLSEDSGSSQTLSVTQSLSLNDDDQGSLTDVTETAHSDDSGSSRTVEVGDDDVPQLLDDDEVDADVSPQTEPQITDAVEPDDPPGSSESTAQNTTLWTAEDESDSAKDGTSAKESGENWDDELSVDLRADDEETLCKYNYCVVQRSLFPLGYERSKTS